MSFKQKKWQKNTFSNIIVYINVLLFWVSANIFYTFKYIFFTELFDNIIHQMYLINLQDCSQLLSANNTNYHMICGSIEVYCANREER
jgi:hypothetical protein